MHLPRRLGFEAAVPSNPDTLRTDCGLRTAFPPEFNSVCACKASIQQEVPELHLDSDGNFVKSHPQRVHDFLECLWILLRKATSSCGRLDSELCGRSHGRICPTKKRQLKQGTEMTVVFCMHVLKPYHMYGTLYAYIFVHIEYIETGMHSIHYCH